MASDYRESNGETHPDRAVIFQHKGKITYLNQKARHMLGLKSHTPEHPSNLGTILELGARGNIETILDAIEDNRQDRVTGRARIRSQSGERSDVNLSIVRRHDLGPDTLHIIAENRESLSGRPNAVDPEKHREFERYYHRLKRPLMVFGAGENDPKLVYLNPAAADYIGFDPDSLLGLKLGDIFPNLSSEGTFNAVLESKSSGSKRIEIGPQPGGRRISLEFSAIDADFILMEIDSRNSQADKQFARTYQDDLFRQLSEHSLAGIYMIQDNIFRYVNPKFADVFGYEQDEMIDKVTVKDIIYEEDYPRVAENVRKRVSGEVKAINHSFRGLRKDGRIVDVEVFGAGMIYEGRPAVIGTLIDITDRNRMETARDIILKIIQVSNTTGTLKDLLGAIRDQLGRIIDTSNFYVAFYDDGIGKYSFPYFSDRYDQIDEYSQKELHQGFTDYVRRTGRVLLADREAQSRIAADNQINLIGTRSSCWLGVPLKSEGRVFGVMVVQSYRDEVRFMSYHENLISLICEQISSVIARKRAEENLRESEERFRSIFDTAQDVIFIINEKMQYTHVNPMAAESMNMAPEEMIGKTDIELFGHDRGSDLIGMNEKVLSGAVEESEEEFDVGLMKKTFHVIKMPMRDRDGRIIGISGIARDITGRRKFEQELEESRSMLKIMLGGLPGMAYRCKNDANYTMLFISAGATELTGYNPEFMIRNNKVRYSDLINPEDRERIRTEIDNAIARNTQFELEYRIQSRSGEEKWVWEKGRAVDFAEDKAEILEGFIMDVTDRKKAESELSRTYRLFIAAIEQIPAGVIIADAPDVHIRIANTAAQEIRGPSALPLTNIHAALHPSRWKIYFPDGSLCFPEELPLSRSVLFGDTITDQEMIIRRDSGEDRWISVSSAPVRDSRGEIVAGVAVFPDITERKGMEENLRRVNEKMRAEQRNLREKNIALREVLGQIDREKEQIEKNVQINVDNVIMPIIESLQESVNSEAREHVGLLTECLSDISSRFAASLQSQFRRLTPRELEICNLIKRGLTSKEICSILKISLETVHQQRKIIRRKLGLTNKDVNLTTYLNTNYQEKP